MTDLNTARVKRIAEVMDASGVDALFATSSVAMGYLAGLFEEGHERFLTLAVCKTGAHRLICPGLSVNQARRAGIDDIASWVDGESPMALLRNLANDWSLKSGVLAIDSEARADILLAMQEALPAALFRPAQPLLAELRARKDANEIRLMRKAAQFADDSLAGALEILKPGVTEIELSERLNLLMRERGGTPAFSIVATGANGAEPHHLSDGTTVRAGDVVVLDYGCTYEGYGSDITRTVACGHASDEAKNVYDVVNRAHQAAANAIAEGVACGAVDAAARAVIVDAGYGPLFNHRTGHGIGLRTHEEPYIAPGSEVALQSGNCFSVEPGIYLPGKFGVRLENIFTVGAGGGDCLNAPFPAEILVV